MCEKFLLNGIMNDSLLMKFVWQKQGIIGRNKKFEKLQTSVNLHLRIWQVDN